MTSRTRRTATKGINLHELVDLFMFSVKADGRSPCTYEYYRKPLGHLLKYAEMNHWPSDIRLVDVQLMRNFLVWVTTRKYDYNTGNGSRRSTTSSETRGWSYYKAARRFFNWAKEEGHIDESPMGPIHVKPPPQALVQPYSVEEIKRLLRICDLDKKTGARFCGVRNEALIKFLIDTALRLKETVMLKLSDIDLEKQIVLVTGKGNRTEICPFSSITAKAVRLYLLERKTRAKCDALWLTEEGTQFTVNGFGSWFARLKARAGLQGPGRIHRLRHTAALLYLRATRDTFLLQLFLRHKDLAMSRRYTQGLQREEAISAHRNGGSPVMALKL